MSPEVFVKLGLSKDEQRDFPLEVAALQAELQLSGQADERLLTELLVIYRRRYSLAGEIGRLFRPVGQSFLKEWVDDVLPKDGSPMPDAEANRRALIAFSAAGIASEDLEDMALAYLAVPGYREQDELYRQTPNYNLLAYIDYLTDFAPFVSNESNQLARYLLLTSKTKVSADLVARFVTLHRQQFEALFQEVIPTIATASQYWARWFSIFEEHATRRSGLTEDYLDTPFEEVVRNVPDQVWYDIVGGAQEQWPFALETKGFYHLAAGKSARELLRELGLSRAAWRAYLALPVATALSEQPRPLVYLWALGLGASRELAAQIPAFLPAGGEALWNPLVQQMARLSDIDWAGEAGQRLLGYVYHILRDQPDFRLNLRQPEALLQAANQHYARIANTQRNIQRERAALRQADQNARQANQEALQEDERHRLREYEKRQKASKWSGLKGVKKLHSPNGKLSIYELTNGWELHLEGVKMGHCVGSYTPYCLKGNFSIWSLRHKSNNQERSIVTIRVDQRKRAIVEARARFNRVPEAEYRDLVNAWAKQNKLGMLEDWERMYYI